MYFDINKEKYTASIQITSFIKSERMIKLQNSLFYILIHTYFKHFGAKLTQIYTQLDNLENVSIVNILYNKD